MLPSLALVLFVMLLGAALGEQHAGQAGTLTPARPRLYDARIQRSAVEKVRIPQEESWSPRIRTSSYRSSSRLETKESPTRRASRISQLQQRARARAARLLPKTRDGPGLSLPEAYSRRLEFNPERRTRRRTAGHSSQIAPLSRHPHWDRTFRSRPNFYHGRVSEERMPAFTSRGRALYDVRSDDALSASESARQSFERDLLNNHDNVQSRMTNKIHASHVAASSNLLTDSKAASALVDQNSLGNLGRVATPRTAARKGGRHAGYSDPRAGDSTDEALLRQDTESDVPSFRGRQLLSVAAAESDGSSDARGRRLPRSTGGQPGGSDVVNCSASGHDEPGVHLVTLRWDVVGVYFTITAFVMFAGLGKLGFHQMHWLSRYVPESCLLIVLGVLMGLLVFFTNLDSSGQCGTVAFPTFNSDSFFLVLLPPIILESAYSLHDRAFVDNLGSVLVFAIFGTLLNIFIIGPSLFGLALSGAMGNFNLTLTESLVFSSLISAVDPVAVLSIFQELGVHKGLYFLVFGESLLNDGVTVVVYNMVSVFMEMTTVKAKDYILSVVAFFVVTLCGALIGVVFGFVTALVTRITTNVRVVEPLALLGFAYLAYLGAELFHFSGIISLIACGLVQAQYAFQNISDKSYTCVKYFTKMASATSETIIFMFLGMVLVSKDHVWHTGFVLWTLLLCFVVRVIITLVLSAIVNHCRVRRIGLSEQLILAYGGLRGAVAFSLVSMLPEDMGLKEHFITATLVVILFTVFIQGITMAPLVRWLDVAKRSSGPRVLFEEVHVSVVDHMMAGIEEVLGEHGDFYIMTQLRVYDEKYLKRWFVRPTCEAPLKRLFEKIAITEHYAHLYGPAELIQQHDLDIYSSKTKLVDGAASNRASVQILTTEDGDGEKLEQLKLEQASPRPELKRRKSSVASILTGWGGGSRRGSAVSSMQDLSVRQLHEDAKLLRRAISSNPYNQLHYKHNRNLVNEDHQELQSHLQRRQNTARRLTRLASRSSISHPLAVAEVDSSLPPLVPTPLIQHQNYWFSGDSTKNRSSKPFPMPGPQDLEPRKSLAPEDAVQLRSRPEGLQSSESSWHRQPHLLPRPRPGRMTSLPGEINPLPEDELVNIPGADEVLEQVQSVKALLQSARRRSLWRRDMLQRRMNRTLSGDDGTKRSSLCTDTLPPAAGGGISNAYPVPEEPCGENEKKLLRHQTAIEMNSVNSAEENLRKLVVELPKSTDEDSAYASDPLSGYSSDQTMAGYSTDSTLPLTTPLVPPAFESIPEHQPAAGDPLLSGASSERPNDHSPKRC